ncbi:MAG: Flp pilus assembly complex ATPase component TadA [Candidatus Omnitrophica bacterium]|nr:Flp pilus assembly complex ATPase component TadA [Candidatus Omnitrophota bacterium]
MKKTGRAKRVKFGNELVKAGIISPGQLKKALGEQRRQKSDDREPLGEILLRLGFINEQKLLEFLEKRLGVPYVELKSGKNISQSTVKLIPERMARSMKAVAIGFDTQSNKIIVAMANPFDIIALDTIKLKTGYEVERRFSHLKEINAAIGRFYEEDALMESVHDFIDIKTGEREKEESLTASKNIIKLEEEAEGTPVIEFVDRLLSNAVRSRASDIHIEPREDRLNIRYRVDGFLNEMFPPPKEMQNAIIARLKLLSEMNIAEQRLPQDGRFKFKFENREIDVRSASTPTTHGEKLVLRLLDKAGLLVDMRDLGMSPKNVEQFKSILKQAYGMTLITGPTGSGKTTTLYSALNYINTPDKNIVTIEDPVEYQIGGINQIQTKHAIGLTFAEGLRAVLRQDPDIIMIGEIRDLETLENAVKASLTGHLVLSTIHTNDASSVVTRLMHMGLEPYLIPSCLSLIIAQRLVRKICPGCREKVTVAPNAISELERRTGEKMGVITFHRGKGCNKCNNTGYMGRIGLYEFLPISKKIRQTITDGVTDIEIKKIAQEEGMKDIYQAGLEKINQGITSLEEVLRVTVLEKSL